ncbi:hypothetical protein ACWC9U_30935 [Streptomyces sp. 900116325]
MSRATGSRGRTRWPRRRPGDAIAISSTTPPQRGDKLTFNWSTDAPDPTHWIGVYQGDRKPSSGVGSLVWAYVPGASGNTTLGTCGLSDGPYTAYLLAKDGYHPGPDRSVHLHRRAARAQGAGHPVRG